MSSSLTLLRLSCKPYALVIIIKNEYEFHRIKQGTNILFPNLEKKSRGVSFQQDYTYAAVSSAAVSSVRNLCAAVSFAVSSAAVSSADVSSAAVSAAGV